MAAHCDETGQFGYRRLSPRSCPFGRVESHASIGTFVLYSLNLVCAPLKHTSVGGDRQRHLDTTAAPQPRLRRQGPAISIRASLPNRTAAVTLGSARALLVSCRRALRPILHRYDHCSR